MKLFKRLHTFYLRLSVGRCVCLSSISRSLVDLFAMRLKEQTSNAFERLTF